VDATEERNSRFLALLKPIQGDCERWAYSLVGNQVDAQDILQQSLLNAISHLDQLRDQARFKWWMFSIIHSTFKIWLRSGKRLAEPVAPEDLAGKSDERSGFAETSERGKAVRRLLEQLSPEQAQALWLFEAEGFSSQEIAKILGKNDGAVRVLLKRSRERLLALLESHGIRPE
jgi:RNA polymerase sigma-70 factor (ECF subfamily)